MKLFESRKRKSGINLTTLIDILFLLIIFFSVSSKFTNQKAISINLPKSKSSSGVSTASRLVVGVQEDNLYINGEKISFLQMQKELESGHYDRSQKVILNIDKAVTHGKVIKLLDLFKLNQFNKVVFGTDGNS